MSACFLDQPEEPKKEKDKFFLSQSYRMNIQKSILFLSTISEELVNKLKKKKEGKGIPPFVESFTWYV